MNEDKRVFVKATATASWYKMGDIIQVLPEKSGRYFKPVNDQNQYIREDDCEICESPQQKEQFSREDACKFAETIALSQWWYSKDTQDWRGSNESYGEIKTTDQLLTEYLNSKK